MVLFLSGPGLQPLRVLSSHHAQTARTVRQDDCLLALLALPTPQFSADPAPGQPVTCPCIYTGESGLAAQSPLQNVPSFLSGKDRHLLLPALSSGADRTSCSYLATVSHPFRWWQREDWGDDVIPNSFGFPICQGGKSRLYCQAKLTDHLFRKVSRGQWAQICGWAAKKVEDRWALGEQTDLELSHAVLEIQEQSLPA